MLIFDQLKRNDPQLRWLTLGALSGIAVLTAGLWWVQIVSSRSYQEHLEIQSYRSVRIPAVRGKILDRNGNVLAENRPTYNVSLYLEELRKQFAAAYSSETSRLTNQLALQASAERKKLGRSLTAKESRSFLITPQQKNWIRDQTHYLVASNMVLEVSRRVQQQAIPLDFTNFQRHYARRLALPYPIAKNLDNSQLARLEEQLPDIPGVDLEIQSLRFYPCQTTAAHLLGYLQRDDSSVEGEDAVFSYRLPDYRGNIGIEYGFDAQLHGHAGEKSVLVNNLGYRQAENIWSPAEAGRDVVLTIDLHVQQAAERALQAARVDGPPRGAVVVMDVNTGDILALASAPVFNPNSFIPGLAAEEARRLNDPQLRPWINRATQENYAPGSVFKPIVGLACLESGLDPKATISNPGYIYVGRRVIHDLAPAGIYDFRLAIMRSSNTYFITNGMRAGLESILRIARRLHLGERIGLPTRQETAGNLPSARETHSGWPAGETANLCIGQGKVDVSPLQMAVVTAALANGGKVLWPRLVDRIESPEFGSEGPPTVYPKGRVRNELGVQPRNLAILKQAMLDEVEDAGTGWRAVVPGLRICGKTGTAQVMNSKNEVIDDTTWFISFAPYEQPRYAVVVMVESGVSGGVTCAPIAAEIYRAILESERANSPRTIAEAK
ncbi:MAG TPA: penicillin-binding transpeptidase domain-containing protein [Verrucomicrobiae bacterium]|nr:penicillin-binding transpeptidase domain-containing protein [Verrucomicrobiae bacterium]